MRVTLVAAALAGLTGACAYDRPAVDRDGALDDAGPDAPIDALVDTSPDVAVTNDCVRDEDCASLVCEAGLCVATDSVRYADEVNGSAIAACTRAAPCVTISQARASAPNPLQVYVVVAPGSYPVQVRLLSGALTLVGTSAVTRPVIADSGGPAIDVRGGTMTLRRLQVTSTAISTADGVRCDGATVVAEDLVARGSTGDGIDSRDCQLTIDRSQITSNGGSGLQVTGAGSLTLTSTVVHGNAFGGATVSAAGDCTLRGSLVDGNGSSASSVGGLSMACGGALVIENLTFARNLTSDGVARDLVCVGAPGAPTLRNLIFASATPQLAGCPTTYSIFEGAGMPPAGTGNRAVTSAGFVDPMSGNFHITAASPAREGGDPATPAALDLDGEARPQARWDVGADEIP